jgi:hypothetical protein
MVCFPTIFPLLCCEARYPLINVSIRNGNNHFFLNVVTRSYPNLLIFYELFYTTRNGKKIKTINNELLIYLNEISLAYWAIDDGA